MEKKISGEIIYDGKIIKVYRDKVELQNGKTSVREVVRHRGAVCIAAIDDDDFISVVTQYRYALGRDLCELPAGKLEEGEEPYSAAVRELREETGLVSEKPLTELGKIYSSVGFCDEVIYLYLAENVHFTATDFDEDEFLAVERIPFKKLCSMVLSGEIDDSKTVALTLKVLALRNRK